jgi:hypothetical protein
MLHFYRLVSLRAFSAPSNPFQLARFPAGGTMPRGLALARSVELRAFAWQLLRDRDRYCTDGPGTAEKNRGLFSLEKYK